MLEVSRTEKPNATIFKLAGNLDTLTAKTFEDAITSDVVDGKAALLVGLAEVDFVSSFGLRSILVTAKKMAPSGRKFILFAPNASVKEVLRVSGFLKIITVSDDEEAALGLLEA
ncbi:STAS domain-containing protein [uncultured Cohaesibacter sp.]|uniref:STAS domain-containing protein n=1 Tax=uncultured Cohaesibacter sp. TaxID=1002546 RepID=UPI0029C5FDA2|nr:STAS domain-containing protein [uncultured Cohaesibacter sp.]